MSEGPQTNRPEIPPEEVARLQASYTRRMRFYRLCWLLWIVGTIIIVFSWIDLVSPTIGWVGFGIALAGTGLSAISHAPYGQRDPFS